MRDRSQISAYAVKLRDHAEFLCRIFNGTRAGEEFEFMVEMDRAFQGTHYFFNMCLNQSRGVICDALISYSIAHSRGSLRDGLAEGFERFMSKPYEKWLDNKVAHLKAQEALRDSVVISKGIIDKAVLEDDDDDDPFRPSKEDIESQEERNKRIDLASNEEREKCRLLAIRIRDVARRVTRKTQSKNEIYAVFEKAKEYFEERYHLVLSSRIFALVYGAEYFNDEPDLYYLIDKLMSFAMTKYYSKEFQPYAEIATDEFVSWFEKSVNRAIASTSLRFEDE